MVALLATNLYHTVLVTAPWQAVPSPVCVLASLLVPFTHGAFTVKVIADAQSLLPGMAAGELVPPEFTEFRSPEAAMIVVRFEAGNGSVNCIIIISGSKP